MSYHKNKYVKYVFNIYAENDQKLNCFPGYEDDGIEQLCPLVGMVFDDLWTDVRNHGNSDSDVEIRTRQPLKHVHQLEKTLRTSPVDRKKLVNFV